MAVDSGTYTPETIQRRQKIAEMLMGESMKPQKITHWAEGLANISRALTGGYLGHLANEEQKDSDKAASQALIGVLGGGASATPQGGTLATPTGAQGAINIPEQYKPIIAQAAKQYGIPEDLLGKQLQAESNFNPQVVSRAGAQGIAQFMPDTAKEMGVDPLNPSSAIPGAAQYLAQNRDRYGGDMTKALAAYNWGPGNVDKWSQSGGDLSKLPNETRNYISKILGPQAIGQQVAQAAPVQGAAGGGDTRAAIINMLNNPNPAVQRMGRQLASGLVQKQLEGEKPTNDMRELSAINTERKARGEAPMGLFDYQKSLKEAGKAVTNINQQQESEYQKTTGKQYGEMNNEIIKSAMSARGKIATLDRLGTLLSDPNISTGAGANLVLDAKRAAKAIGIDVGDVGPAEAVRSIGNQFALELRNPSGGAGMPGALSDKDREFLQASVPGLMQNPEGNKLIIDYMKRVAKRSIDVERLRQAYVKKNGRIDDGFFTELADFADKNPLFKEGEATVAPPAPNPEIDTLLKRYGK